MKILFITSNRIGDAVLSTGILDRLIEEHPRASITLACGPAAAPLFEAMPNLERIIAFDKMLFSLHWPVLWAACAGKVWDLVVDLRNSPLGYLLVTRARGRMGRREPVHRVRQLAAVLGLNGNPPPPRLWLGEEHRRAALELVPDGPPVLAVGPTANWPAKIWRAEYFVGLIERLGGEGGILPGARIAVLGGEDERPLAVRLIESIPPRRRIDLMGRVDPLVAHACLCRCAFFVGNDSGLMHLAAASGIPTLGLFGPSRDDHFGPWGPHTAVVRTSVPFERLFPADFDRRTVGTLMDSLTVDAAEEAAHGLWARTGDGAP